MSKLQAQQNLDPSLGGGAELKDGIEEAVSPGDSSWHVSGGVVLPQGSSISTWEQILRTR